MSYKQVRDIVARIRIAHRQLRDALERPEPGDPRTIRLLETLRREEQRMQRALGSVGSESESLVLDTWLQYSSDEELFAVVSSIEFSAEMPPDEIITRKLEFDGALIRLLRQLVDETPVPRVREYFLNLLEHVETRTTEQVWSMREFQPGEGPPPPR